MEADRAPCNQPDRCDYADEAAEEVDFFWDDSLRGHIDCEVIGTLRPEEEAEQAKCRVVEDGQTDIHLKAAASASLMRFAWEAEELDHHSSNVEVQTVG